jgi:hypothetical protein
MPVVTFRNADQFQFGLQFLPPNAPTVFGATTRDDALQIEVRNPVVGELLQRVADGRVAVLPYIPDGGGPHNWIIAGPTLRELDQAFARASHFVVPTYAEYPTPSRTPHLNAFDPNRNALQRYGAVLYPAGYYSWRSPPRHLDIILGRLDLWMRLESAQPTLRRAQPRTYHDLYTAFMAALAAMDWDQAERALTEVRALHLSSADNLAFLEIQLLAARQSWRAIWELPDFATVANMRMPRTVRTAMLSAFHHSELLALEQQERWHEALTAYRDARPRLGRLLLGRFDIVESPVLHVFAFEAVNARDRRSLDELRLANAPADVTRCLDALARFLPPVGPLHTEPKPDPLQLARAALANADLDAARRHAAGVDNPITKALLLVDIATQGGDIATAEEALLAFWDLPIEAQHHLLASDRRIQRNLEVLNALTGSPSPANEALAAAPPRKVIRTWADWFDLAERSPDDPELFPALDHLAAITDERSWSAKSVAAMADQLLRFLDSPVHRAHPYAKAAIEQLIAYFLRDEHFPRGEAAYGELYETLYASCLLLSEINESTSRALLRLTEAILRRAPSRRDAVCANFCEWFAHPVPRLEACVLDAFELLGEYGLPGGALSALYRMWAGQMIALPGWRDRLSLEAWLSFGDWIQPGEDILGPLRRRLDAMRQETVDDPVASLAPGYRIGIFTLRPIAAMRAGEMLRARSVGIDLQICAERDLNDHAVALARNSDLVVVVASCITHALTYGISPYIDGTPVYPTSSGSTSIVRAIENRLQASHRPGQSSSPR